MEVVNRLDVFIEPPLVKGSMILTIGEESALTIINVHHMKKLL